MQEEIEQKSFNIMISTTKLSARTVLRAVKAAFRLYQSKASQASRRVRTAFKMIGGITMSEKSDKLRAMLAKEKERRIKLNNRIEILERRIQEEDSAEVNEMVRTAKVTPEQLAALLRQSANTTPNPAALSAVGATFEKEDANED